MLQNRLLCHTFLALFLGFAFLKAQPVTLKNPSLTVIVQPKMGGKISALLDPQGKGFSLTAQQLADPGNGLAKERIAGDALDFASTPYKVLQKSPQSITMRCDPLPKWPQLQITKTISLPPQGDYVRVHVVYKNIQPVMGPMKIVPWIHNVFIPSGKGDSFLLPNVNGISETHAEAGVKLQNPQTPNGNWLLYKDKAQNRQLLLVSANRPLLSYDFISDDCSTLEMLFHKVDPIPDYALTYYLTMRPQTKLPVAPVPAIPTTFKPAPATTVNIEAFFRSLRDASLPVDICYWKSKAWISKDVPLPLVFGIKNASKTTRVEVELDLPQAIQLTSPTFGYYASWPVKELGTQPLQTPNGTWLRHRFQMEAPRHGSWNGAYFRLIAKATEDIKDFTLKFRILKDGTTRRERNLPGSVISIPKAKVPKDFKLIMGIDYWLYQNWKDVDLAMKHLGINGLCFNPTRMKPQESRKFYAGLKEKGYTTAILGIFFNPSCGWGNKLPPERQAMTLQGKLNRYFDFTARGPWLEDVRKHAAKYMNRGCDYAISDYEPYFGGSQISFTQRTIEGFKDYLKTCPNPPAWIDPKVFAKHPETYKELNRLWTDYKCEAFLDYLNQVITPVRTKPNASKLAWCTIPGTSEEMLKKDTLTDQTKFTRLLDANCPMLYNNLYHDMVNYIPTIDLFRKLVRRAGTDAKLMPTLTAGFWEEGNPFPASHTYLIVLESALTQCDGIYVFPGFAGSDNENIREMTRALNLIALLEPFLKTALRQDNLATVTTARDTFLDLPVGLNKLGLVSENKALLYLAEYSAHPVKVDLTFNLKAPAKATILNGNDLGTVMPGEKRTLTLTPQHKGIIIRLNTLDGKPFPLSQGSQNASPQTPSPNQASNLIFYDSFDHGTQGQDAVPDHFFTIDDLGFKGKSLYLKDYESAWKLNRSFPIASGNITFDFRYRAPGTFTAGNMQRNLIQCNLSTSRKIILFFNPQNGKLRFSVIDTPPGKKSVWWPIYDSQTDRWGGNFWQHIQLTVGKDGVKLIVDGKTEIKQPSIGTVTELSNLQLGNQWLSMGRFDELMIFDGTTSK